MAPPMFNSGYYTIPGYVVAETVKPQFLFLFLPRKEKIKVAIGVPCWWRVLSLQESGWGPPGGSLRMAHQESSEFRDAEETGLSGLLPPDYPACYHRIIRPDDVCPSSCQVAQQSVMGADFVNNPARIIRPPG